VGVGAPQVFPCCEDHVEADGLKVMKATYFGEKLANLTTFEGFVPRWYVPATDIYSKDDPSNHATQTLAIIDTALEIKVGVGYDWPPKVLGKNKI